MKILELRFKNLNSLYGEWHIDFTRPEYLIDGIFAITGPTGSGKSTILDAICLALYGETPRLGKITAKNNEIISRRTAECYAEVTFSSSAGTFRCHWSQSRARKKIEGALQEAKHEISNALNGELLESKKSSVKIVIEEKTGMNFERFTRSILLAQGSFAAFLQASADERSPILEQITGTEIYSEISKKVHEKQKVEKEKLDILLAELGGMIVLDEAQENNLKQQYTEKSAQIEIFTKQQKSRQNAIQQYQQLNTLTAELAQLNAQQKQILEDIEQFSSSQQKLDWALKAAELDGDFATLTALRDQQKVEQGQLTELDAQLPKVMQNLAEKKAQLDSAKTNFLAIKEKQKLAIPLINQVRALDLQQVEKRKQLEPIQNEINQLAAKIEKNRSEYQAHLRKKEEIAVQNQQTQNYLSTHAQDAQLIEKFAGIQEQLNHFQQDMNELSQNQVSIQQRKKSLAEHSTKTKNHHEHLVKVKKTYDEYQQAIEQDQKSLSALLGDRLLREYRLDKEYLQKEKLFMVKIGKLEEERQKLMDGEPCPLCGAVEHPFALGNIPEMDEVDQKLVALTTLIERAESLENELQQAKDKMQYIVLKKDKTEKEIEVIAAQVVGIEESLQELMLKQTEITTRSDQLKSVILAQLNMFGISALPENNDMATLIAELSAHRDNWSKHQESSRLYDEQVRQIEEELKKLDSFKQHFDDQLADKQAQLNELEQQKVQIKKQRQSLYGEASPDEEEEKLEKAVIATEQQLQEVQKNYDEIKEQDTQIKTKKQTLLTNIRQRSDTLEHQERSFIARLEKKEFVDEAAFLACRLSAQERVQLSERAKLLTNKKMEIMAKLQDRETRHAEMKKQVAMIQGDCKTLEQESKLLSEQLNEHTQALGAIQQQLTDNERVKAKLKDKQQFIDQQQKEYHNWLKLHGLIGSSDGKKYRNFAQSLTFEIMVAHANHQLTRMTDRYLLISSKDPVLELNVIDNYQAGEIRSTKNLSGGESFIVSLALALGLSKMSSQKVRVDSLFLDEGFGTLDEEALEMALSALAGLQQEGKLIGVISHVSTLKERINTQINVVPLNNGRSQLTGIGCYQSL